MLQVKRHIMRKPVFQVWGRIWVKARELKAGSLPGVINKFKEYSYYKNLHRLINRAGISVYNTATHIYAVDPSKHGLC